MSPRTDPYKNFNFRVEIDGIAVAGFSECSGLSSSVDVIEYREGADNVIRKLPGFRKFGNITLKRGITKSRQLYDWHRALLGGDLQRRNGAIVLRDDAQVDQVRWVFIDGFPQRYDGPELRGKGNEVAIETLTICCEGLYREE